MHLRVLVELIQNDLRLGSALEADQDAHSIAVALIAEVVFRDVGDDLVVDQLGDALDELGFVDLVGDLGDDDRLAAVLELLDRRFGAHQEASTARLISLRDSAPPVDEAAGGKIGPLHMLENFGEAGLWIVQQLNRRVDHFGQIVRRDVGRHADSNTVGTIDDEVGNARGQNRGLGGALVVVGDKVDRVLLDIGEHLGGNARHAAFGVTHGRRRVAVYGAEVALAIHHGVTQAERLGQTHQGVVDRRIAMGVIDAHGLTDDLGALGVLFVELQAHLMQGVEDAAMDRLEAVANLRQRAPDDHRHRIIEIRPPHLVFNVDGDEIVLRPGGVASLPLGAPRGSSGF